MSSEEVEEAENLKMRKEASDVELAAVSLSYVAAIMQNPDVLKSEDLNEKARAVDKLQKDLIKKQIAGQTTLCEQLKQLTQQISDFSN